MSLVRPNYSAIGIRDLGARSRGEYGGLSIRKYRTPNSPTISRAHEMNNEEKKMERLGRENLY